jgi:hypothetical protein
MFVDAAVDRKRSDFGRFDVIVAQPAQAKTTH